MIQIINALKKSDNLALNIDDYMVNDSFFPDNEFLGDGIEGGAGEEDISCGATSVEAT